MPPPSQSAFGRDRKDSHSSRSSSSSSSGSNNSGSNPSNNNNQGFSTFSNTIGGMSNSSLPVPSPKQSKWDYLNSLETSPRLSRWEYLNSLEGNNNNRSTESINIPNIAPTDFGGETFYNEPNTNNSSSSSLESGHRVSNSKYRFVRWFQDRQNLLMLAYVGLLLLLTVLVGVFLGGSSSSDSSQQKNAKAAVDTFPDSAVVETTSTAYQSGEDIIVRIKTAAANPKSTYWVGVWQSHYRPGDRYTISDVPAAMWMNICGDSLEDTDCSTTKETTLTFSATTDWQSEYTIDWPLCNGNWVACVIDQESGNTNLGCTETSFAVYGGTCHGVCLPATEAVNDQVHLNPVPHTPVSKIAFGSSFAPNNQVDSELWDHVRHRFQPDVWVWLGDNVNAEGEDMEQKRVAYNLGKSDPYYRDHGPLADPKIPVTGTWNDNDSGSDNTGAEYQCHRLAQDEFAYWFNLPENDPRHPAQGVSQRKGVYSSIMFAKPGEPDVNGIHLIMLDVRTFRSPTFNDKGYCQHANSTVLGKAQWEWLEAELKKPSKIKIIASGMQVMQPTDQIFNDVETYCANDGDTFFEAIDSIEEDRRWLGTRFEGWQQIPQEKVRLMKLLQHTLNRQTADRIVIISGDMHWGEMMAKKMPPDTTTGEPAQLLYEVTASGIDQNWPNADPNANRIRIRTADSQGDGMYQRECRFPFRYKGMDYYDCVGIDQDAPWCALHVDIDNDNEYITGQWGNCMREKDELVPRGNITSSGENSCDDSLHVCSAQANYGGIEVDWDNNFMKLSVFTPHATDPVAAEVRIGL